MSLFILMLWDEPFFFLSWVLAVAFSICLHEFFHAAMALKMGDDTAAQSGHLTLNPLVQMGWSSLVMLLVLGIAWGSVPVNPLRLRGRVAPALVAFAGPAANLLLCVTLGGLAALSARVPIAESLEPLAQFSALASAANGVLFLFNLLPIPMFDGWPIFALLIPAMHRIGVQQAQTFSWLFILLVFMTKLGSLIWSAGLWVSGVIMLGWGRLFDLLM